MSVTYTSPELVTDTRVTQVPNAGWNATGYGAALPTRHMVKYLGVWRRVYLMSYGNGGSAYVNVKGVQLFLDVDTQNKLQGTD